MNNIKLSPAFLLVFGTVLSITMLSGGTSMWLASKPNLSEYQVRNLEDSRATWQMGIGCIFGLLGSKATHLLESEKDK
ncbi:hypothetical protein [Nostoc sp.]|uniref:hypothetical protein n=1 Tax=Nostoc sp. TaxID=1180 RepID=UPI0035943040